MPAVDNNLLVYELITKTQENVSHCFTGEEWKILGIGLAVAFLSALIAVKVFIAFLTRYGFKYFGYYRIVLGILFLIFALATGIELQD